MKISCLRCGELYECNLNNVTQIGPILETQCPFCKIKIVKNFSKFVALQIEENFSEYERLSKAKAQINLAQEIAALVNEDKPVRKRKKK